MPNLGDRQLHVLHWVKDGSPLDCGDDNGLYRICLRLHARRLLSRRGASAKVFYRTDEGVAAIAEADGETA